MRARNSGSSGYRIAADALEYPRDLGRYPGMNRLATLVSGYDVFEFADHEQGYVLARLEEREFAELAAAGFRVEAEATLTQELRRALGLADAVPSGA